ncbi:hypothetical protein FF38_10041, partial [Lucilia cuprina]
MNLRACSITSCRRYSTSIAMALATSSGRFAMPTDSAASLTVSFGDHKVGWIDLHRGEAFSKWVDFLGAELERVATTDENKLIAEKAAVHTMQLEFEFFESCYNFKE